MGRSRQQSPLGERAFGERRRKGSEAELGARARLRSLRSLSDDLAIKPTRPTIKLVRWIGVAQSLQASPRTSIAASLEPPILSTCSKESPDLH